MEPTTNRSARRLLLGAGLAAVALLGAACSESEDAGGEGTEPTSPTPAVEERCEGDGLLECARESTIGDLVPDEPVEATGEELVLGMVNQENTPGGSYPELSQAVNAAIDFVNEQLGGVDGRPIRLEVCNTDFSAEGSTSCGQQFVEAGIPVVLGGIDVFGTAIEVLEDNGVAYAGGIPISSPSVQAGNSFQWSGGTWGASVAFANHAATELGAQRVAIVYGEFGAIAESAEYAETVLTDAGVETVLVPYPIMATDIASPMQAAIAEDPDAVIVLAADAGCGSAFEAAAAMELEAQLYVVGACAAPSIVDATDVAATNGVVFNVEGPVSSSEPTEDNELYNAIVDRYGDGLNPIGAGTVSFRSFMNLYAILSDLGADGIDPASVLGSLGEQQDAPSFMGHDYTCDGEQFAGLPAMCSPQQILANMEDRELDQLGSWVDVGAIYRP